MTKDELQTKKMELAAAADEILQRVKSENRYDLRGDEQARWARFEQRARTAARKGERAGVEICQMQLRLLPDGDVAIVQEDGQVLADRFGHGGAP